MHVAKNQAPKTRLERINSIRMFCKWLHISAKSADDFGSLPFNRIWWPRCTEICNRPWMRCILNSEEVVLIILGATLD